jgi:nucleoside-diphosphate-sugar epimerase
VDILVVGGNRFVGHLLVARLLAKGDRVTLFNRGNLPDAYGDRVERIHGDRTKGELSAFLAKRGKPFDGVVDFAAFTGAEVEEMIAALSKSKAHYIFISTGQVYLVREGAPWPASESDYEGPVIPRPTDEKDLSQWTYGADKRAGEDALFRAHRENGFRFTTFRIPMVNGARDYIRRMEGYLFRMLDGEPLILPGGGTQQTRHVYAPDVAAMIASVLESSAALGRAYNLSQDEMPTLNELLGKIATHLGARLRTVDIPREQVIAAGLEPVMVSPYSGLWMSRLDPAKAKEELGFVHCPLDQYLRSIVEAFVAHFPAAPPEGYQARARELELIRSFRA